MVALHQAHWALALGCCWLRASEDNAAGACCVGRASCAGSFPSEGSHMMDSTALGVGSATDREAATGPRDPMPVSLRELLALLEAHGDLKRISRSVSPEFEISALARRSSDVGGPACLMENVAGYPGWTVSAATYASLDRVRFALGALKADAVHAYIAAVDAPIARCASSPGPSMTWCSGRKTWTWSGCPCSSTARRIRAGTSPAGSRWPAIQAGPSSRSGSTE
ncbi:MAG: hypothetical protein EXR69_13890 [Myxococcales bacterium]|nr:hypothetical protein [Myxococcales bacterium]